MSYPTHRERVGECTHTHTYTHTHKHTHSQSYCVFMFSRVRFYCMPMSSKQPLNLTTRYLSDLPAGQIWHKVIFIAGDQARIKAHVRPSALPIFGCLRRKAILAKIFIVTCVMLFSARNIVTCFLARLWEIKEREERRCRKVLWWFLMAAWNKGLRLCCKSRRKEGRKEGEKWSCYRVEKAF